MSLVNKNNQKKNILELNMKYSRDACFFILNTLNSEGANWDFFGKDKDDSWEQCEDEWGDLPSARCLSRKKPSDICVYEVARPKIEAKLKERRLKHTKNMIKEIEIIANITKINKCGNCGELSALAFKYLYDLGVRPLDWIGMLPVDHACVVIGRDNNDINERETWGQNATVCDPWAQGFFDNSQMGSYPGNLFNTMMRRTVPLFTSIRLIHREG